MKINKRGMRTVSACVVAGAVGFGSAALAETDWNALSGADWGKQVQDQDEKIAEAGAGGGQDWGAEIQKAFVELGMAEQRAACYGDVLVEKLSPEGQQEAAQMIRTAGSADEVKTSVISGGPEMVGGFSAADAACPENMGG